MVLTGSEEREKFPSVKFRPLLDVVAYLKRHGVEAEVRGTDATGTDAGTAILEAARDVEADPIPMGAFGRSRL